MHNIPSKPIANREELIDHLTIAAELEHTFLVQYLFAAFSIKMSFGKDAGLKPYHEEKLKSWKSRILSVAREEMGHLGTVCNLLSAIGAAPHFGRPNFPQFKDTYYPFEIQLERFGEKSLYQFIRYELPKDTMPPLPPASLHFSSQLMADFRNAVEYEYVGELYGKIRKGFEDLKDLFIGPRYAQDTDDWSRRLRLHLVTNAEEAAAAIDCIVLEGEGSPGSPGASHYGTFLRISAELAAEHDSDPNFEPARRVISNPRTVRKHSDAPIPDNLINLITNDKTLQIAGAFNDVYEIAVLMLMQYYSFSGETAAQRKALQEAIREIMSTTVRPLGEVLTELPAYRDDTECKAGAPFEFYSTLRLSTQLKTRWIILLERLEHTANAIRAVENVHSRLSAVARNLTWLRQNIVNVLETEFVLEPKATSEKKRVRDAPLSKPALKEARPPYGGAKLERKPASRHNLCLKFSGWFQCRLAINPTDPPDEPRGVTGLTYAAVGEPDLDRIIRLQPDRAVPRYGCRKIGVEIISVFSDGACVPDHPLRNAKVDFLDNPKFVGENGIVADPNEPIIPFHLRICKGALRLSRRYAGSYDFPFAPDLFGKQPTYCPGEISEATGISDLVEEWRRRIDLLKLKLQDTSDDIERAALIMRMNAMDEGIKRDAAGEFYGKMPYYIPIVGIAPEVEDPENLLGIDQDENKKWHVEFWMGGWDFDALCGFIQGFVTVPTRK